MSSHAKRLLTPEQYLEIERKAEFRSEYYQGEMFAMSGASYAHADINGNLMRDLRTQTRGTKCKAFSNDMRVHIPAVELYTYPDIVVLCGQALFSGDKPDTLLNPKLIIEILSPSTAAYDRGQKFEFYRRVPTLEEYLMVSAARPYVERFTRRDGEWIFQECSDLAGIVALESVGCSLKMSDIYEDVEFSEPTPTASEPHSPPRP